MNKLFIELYIDEDVDVLVAELVQAHGFTATTTRDAGNLHASDEEQLSFASENGFAFLTHNRDDFEKLARRYLETRQFHAGIIIARRRSPYELVRRLLVILNHVTADEIQNQIRHI